METLLSPANAIAAAARIILSSQSIIKQSEERMMEGGKVGEEERGAGELQT